jgi:hypothetical protein
MLYPFSSCSHFDFMSVVTNPQKQGGHFVTEKRIPVTVVSVTARKKDINHVPRAWRLSSVCAIILHEDADSKSERELISSVRLVQVLNHQEQAKPYEYYRQRGPTEGNG